MASYMFTRSKRAVFFAALGACSFVKDYREDDEKGGQTGLQRERVKVTQSHS